MRARAAPPSPKTGPLDAASRTGKQFHAQAGGKPGPAPGSGVVSGVGVAGSWGMGEEIQDHFNFAVGQAQVDAALRQDKYVVLNPQTGAESPLHWLAEAGVPTVKVCFKLNQKDPEAKCTPELADHSYPYHSAKYFS